MDFDEIVKKLCDRRLNLSEVSKTVGLSRFTLHKLINGTQKTLKIENFKKLIKYFTETTEE